MNVWVGLRVCARWQSPVPTVSRVTQQVKWSRDSGNEAPLRTVTTQFQPALNLTVLQSVCLDISATLENQEIPGFLNKISVFIFRMLENN